MYDIRKAGKHCFDTFEWREYLAASAGNTINGCITVSESATFKCGSQRMKSEFFFHHYLFIYFEIF